MSLIEALSLYCGDVIRNFRLALELRRLSVDMVRALVSAVDQKDAYTSGHSNRVGEYATLLGAEAGLNDEELQMLEWSALLHDVGKIGIRDDVLKKPGKLTEDEFAHIKEHPVRSYEVVRQVPQLAAALAGVRHHHERWDGKGYPDGLVGEDIPLQARIIQVADIFDALTTSRSYRGAYEWEKALSILHEEAGKATDRRLVDIFDRLVRRQVALGRFKFQDAVSQEQPEPRQPSVAPLAGRSTQ
jgi:HD-GYP domain-containing protein (c-di-GMP phosphodiesterase class II)